MDPSALGNVALALGALVGLALACKQLFFSRPDECLERLEGLKDLIRDLQLQMERLHREVREEIDQRITMAIANYHSQQHP